MRVEFLSFFIILTLVFDKRGQMRASVCVCVCACVRVVGAGNPLQTMVNYALLSDFQGEWKHRNPALPSTTSKSLSLEPVLKTSVSLQLHLQFLLCM